MTGTEEQADPDCKGLRHWRQGDVSRETGLEFIHLADLSRPQSPASLAVSAEGTDGTQTAGMAPVVEEVAGFVVLTQTCDIVRSFRKRPYIEVAPLAPISHHGN